MARRLSKKNSPPRIEADGIPVHCAFDEIVSLKDLKPNPRNPNKHPTAQVELLARIIQSQGWRAPITVSTRSGYIVRGHGRLEAAQKLKRNAAPIDFQDYETDEAELADLIADNRLAELGGLDMLDISELLKEMDTTHLALTGYSDVELARLLQSHSGDTRHLPADLPNPGIEGEDTRTERFILVYMNEQERQQLMDLLGIDGSKVLYLASEIFADGE